MKTQKRITFSDLKPHISRAIKESCLTADAVIYKIADETHHIQTVTVEPGVEIARGLSIVIDTTIQVAVHSGCDLSVISKGILIGAFRASRSVLLESHKTIRLLVNEILQSVFKYNGSIKQVIEGLLAAVVIIAKEQGLNVQEALKITAEDMLSAADKINPQFGQNTRINIPKEYEGIKLLS